METWYNTQSEIIDHTIIVYCNTPATCASHNDYLIADPVNSPLNLEDSRSQKSMYLFS